MKAAARSVNRAGTPGSAGWLRLAAALSLACAGCSGGERASAPDGSKGQAFSDATRPDVVCRPPPAGADALLAAPYAVCAEYRAGRIDGTTYAAALAGTGAMVIAIVALEALDAPSKAPPATVTVRSQVIQALHQNAAVPVLCRAPSLAAYGALPACTLISGSSPTTGNAPAAVMTATR